MSHLFHAAHFEWQLAAILSVCGAITDTDKVAAHAVVQVTSKLGCNDCVVHTLEFVEIWSFKPLAFQQHVKLYAHTSLELHRELICCILSVSIFFLQLLNST